MRAQAAAASPTVTFPTLHKPGHPWTDVRHGKSLRFEKLFGKVSDVVHHKIAPYADERQRFLEPAEDERRR